MSNLLFMDESNGNGGYLTTTTTTAANASVSRTKNNIKIKNKNNNNNNVCNNIIINNNNNNNNSNSSSNSNSNNNNTSNSNISNIMAAASNAVTAAASVAGPCVGGVQLPNAVSNEDLSQSLSEYTDADESISAPTEFLAEFLSAVMLKDYKKALKYCKLILQYEPDNSTAKEFYPLILNKLRCTNTSSDSDENYNKSSSSPEFILDAPSTDPSVGESDEHDEQYLRHSRNGTYGGLLGVNGDAAAVKSKVNNIDPNSNVSSSSSAEIDVVEEDEIDGDEEEGCGSIDASLSDEDVEDDDGDVDDDDDCEDDDDDDDDDDEDDIMSSSGDDLPVDEQQILVHDVLELDASSSANACGVEAAINISNSSRNSSSGGKGSSRSDNTTHSYSSLLLEEEDDIVPANLHFPKDLHTTDLDVSNGNKVPSTSCSDSESPTEPLTQRLAAILRSKCGVSNTGG